MGFYLFFGIWGVWMGGFIYMSIALIDYLLDCIEPNFLPSFECAIIICNHTCKVSESISNEFSEANSIEVLKNGGCFVFKVKHEVQRGFLINYLSNALQPTVFSHRPETLTKVLSLKVVLPLITPERTVNKPLKRIELSVKNVDTSLALQESPIERQEAFKKIYQESLEKYVKIILGTPNRAEKIKSFKAQIRNIVDGIIISNKKKSGVLVDFNADKVTESIISDLESHEIIRLGSSNVLYCELLIEQFFGVNKVKVFIPGFNSDRDRDIAINKDTKTENKFEPLIKDWDKGLYEYCLSDSEIFDSRTIGELYYCICMCVINSCKKEFESFQANEFEVIEKILKKIVTEFFLLEMMSVDDLMKDVHLNFSLKICKI